MRSKERKSFCARPWALGILVIVLALQAPRAFAIHLEILEGSFARLLMRETPSGRALVNLVTSYRGAEVNEGLYAQLLLRLSHEENSSLRPVLAAQIEEIEGLYRARREASGRSPELAPGEVPTADDLVQLRTWAQERFESESVVDRLVVTTQLLRTNEVPVGVDMVAQVREQIRRRFESARNGETLFGEGMAGDLIGGNGLADLPRARTPRSPVGGMPGVVGADPALMGGAAVPTLNPGMAVLAPEAARAFSFALEQSQYRILRWWLERGMRTELPRLVERVENAANRITRWLAQRALRTRLSRELMALFKVYGVDVSALRAQPWFAALQPAEQRQLLSQALQLTDNYLRLLKVPTTLVRLQWQLEAYTRIPPELLVRLNRRTEAQLNAFRDGVTHSAGGSEQYVDITALLVARLEVARSLGLSEIVTETERVMLETIQKLRTLGGGRIQGTPHIGSIQLGERNIHTLEEEIQDLRANIAEHVQVPVDETPFARRSRELERAEFQSRLDSRLVTLEQTRRELHQNLQEFAESFEQLRLFINLRSGLVRGTRVRPISMPDVFVVTQVELDEWRSQLELAMENYLRPHELMLVSRRQLYQAHLRGETQAFVRKMYQWNIDTVGKLLDPTLTRERLEEYIRNGLRERAQLATRQLMGARVGRFTVGTLLGGGTATTAVVGAAGAGVDWLFRHAAGRIGITVPNTPIPPGSNPSRSSGGSHPSSGGSHDPSSSSPANPATSSPGPVVDPANDPSLPPALPPEVLNEDRTPPGSSTSTSPGSGGSRSLPPPPVDPFGDTPSSAPQGSRDGGR